MTSNPETRRCPRCGGNLFLDKDSRGWFVECLQCSYSRDLNSIKQDYRKEKGLRIATSGIDNIKRQ